jgi:hypothetical protein
MSSVDDDDLAIWLGKIFWLLCRKSNASIDPKTCALSTPDKVIPDDTIRGTTFLGFVERTFAVRKGMYSCYGSDPPIPEFFYGPPYSLYRFKIDTRDSALEMFDFKDNPVVLGVAMRTGNFGVICVYDGGLHRDFRSQWLHFLTGKSLHPQQFNEVVGRVFYDQTVLDPEANEITYYWNRPLKAIVAVTQTPRRYNPYLKKNYDASRCAQFVARFVNAEPSALLSKDGKHVLSGLTDKTGKFRRYPIKRRVRSDNSRL